MLEQIENSILWYIAGLEIQNQVLGQKNPQICETCRYVTAAHVQILQFDEVIFAYQKILAAFKSTKGENHASITSVFVHLASLYNKIRKFKKSKSNCENALRFCMKPIPGNPLKEIVSGLIEVSAIYEISMNKKDLTLNLLHRALKVYDGKVRQQSRMAEIEAQIGVFYHLVVENKIELAILLFDKAMSKWVFINAPFWDVYFLHILCCLQQVDRFKI